MGEYNDSMGFRLDEAVGILQSTPRVFAALLQHLPEEWLNAREAPDTFSPLDVLGHLIHAERTDWIPRAKIILECGESRPFDPFDRFAQMRESEGKSLEQLLDDFGRLRSESLTALQGLNLQSADLARRGTHPALGTVTLSELLATWAVHDLTHLHQLSRVMAYQYRGTVGPWNAFLGVLKCAGHSAG